MQRAVNPQTGEVLFLIDNQWKKPEQTAINPQTGERAFLVNNQWEVMPAFQPPEPVGEVQADTFEQTPEEMITPLPERPTQALEAPEPGILEGLGNIFKRSGATYRDVSTSLLLQTGAIDPTDAAFLLKENARRRGAAAPSMAIQEGMAEIAGAETYGDAVAAMASNPAATLTMLADSIVTSLPAVAPGLVLGPAGPVVAGATAALGSGGLEYGAVMTDVLQDKGIDLSDPFAVTRALENPEIMGEIKEKGAKRGLIIGAFDGISVGLAGRFLNPTMDLIEAGKLTGDAAKKAFYANTAKELTTQTALGAGGEFAAQVATGEDRPADVLLEGLAGLATAPIEVAASRRQAAEAEEAAAQPPTAPPAAPAAPRVEPTLGPTPPAPAAVTPPPTPPALPEEAIVPFAQGEFEGEEAVVPAAPPVAQREPIEEPPPMFGKPAPVSEDELARRREMKALEKEQRTLGAPTKEQNMFSVLKGKLDKKSLTDLGLDLSPSRIRQLSAPKTERGRRLEEVIGDGELDEFLPFGLRLASMPPDASADDMLDREQAAFEYMIDKLAKDDPLSYEASVELRRIGYELDQLQQEGRLDEINRELQAIADEELLARTEAAAVAPEKRGIVGAEGAPGTEAARQAAQQAGVAPSETVRVYHSGSVGEGDTGRFVSTNLEYASNYRPDLPLFYLDLPASDPRVQSDVPGQGVKQGFTFNFELTPEEAAQLKPIERAPQPKAAPAESDVDKLAEAFPNVPREQFEGVGSFAKVKPYIQAAYNKGNLKQIETILNSLRKAAPPVVREPQKEIEITKTPREFYMEMIPAAGFKRLEPGDPRRYKNKAGKEFLTFERDGVRIAVEGNTILYADARGVGMYMGEGTDLLLQAMIVDDSARRQGRATKAMQDILSLADQAGMTTYIEPVQITKDVGMSTDQLKAFYKRFGFEPQKTEPATDRVMVREPQKPKAIPEEKRLADLERDLFRLTPPPTPERGAPRAAQADLFGAAGLESLPPAPELAKKKRQNNQQLSLFGSEVIDQSENNTAGRKARKAAIDEVKAMQETDTPMGLSFADEFAQKQRANLVGQKINSAADLAVLSQVYRDPRFETFRLFFTDGENNIISQLGVTSRLPGSSNAIIGNDLNKYLVEVQKAAKDVGAVGFWMLHNHPSGNVQSSRADILLTKTFNKYMPGLNLLGHVIIDTNKYGFIRSDGTYTEVSKDMGQKDLVEFQNGAYSDFFKPIEVAKRVDENPDSMVFIVMNNGLDVTGITTLPNSDFIGKTPEQVKRTLMKTALRNMGSRMLVASRNRDALKAVGPVVEDGIYIKDNGQYERFNQMFAYRTVLTFPLSRPGVVTADSSKLFDFLRKPKIAEPGRSKYLNWQDLRVLEPKEDLFGAQTLAKVDSLPKDKSKLPPGRSPELAELTERFARGEISRAERDEAVEKYKKVRVWEEPLEPASEEAMRNALNVVQRQKVDAPIPDGTKVGTRIDIEAARKGVSVVTIHEAKPKVTSPAPGSPISYRSVAKLKNVQFAVGSEKKAFEIAKGRKKDALQTMEGTFVNITPAEAKREMDNALSDPEYIQIGLDPTAHSYFFDRVTKLPVISADEVIQIGSQVLAKGVEFQESETFLFNITDDQGHLFEGEGVEKVDSVPAGVKKKVKKGRSPELTEMAEKLKRGEITKEEYDDAVNRFSKISVYAEVPRPATEKAVVDALDANKRPYANTEIKDGTKVGLRLDIPALERHGVGVVSIHEAKPSLTSPKAGKILSYRSVGALKNVKFALGDQTKALDTAAGEFKDKLQTMEGNYVNLTPEEAFAKAKEALNDPDYIQIGLNPTRHAYFYDRLTTLPVVSADEVIQIGQLVLAKGVEFGDKADFLYDIGNPTTRTDKEVKDAIKRDRDEIIGFYQGLRQRRAALVRKVEKGEVSINIQRRLNELNELAKEMQLEAKILYEPNLSARAFRNRAEKAFLDGDIEADVLGVVETMLAKYPGLLEGLQLSVKTDKTLKEAAGSFNPLKRMVNLYKGTSGTMKPMSIRHELSHAMEQMMPIGAREAVIREWSKAFQAAIKKHTDKKSQEYFQKVLEFLDRPSMARLQAATNAMPSYDFYQYLNPSEYWAVNAEKLMAAQLGTPWNRFVKAMKRLFEGMKKILGFDNKYATHKVFDQIISGSMKRLDRGSLLDYMLDGDTDIDFLMNVKDVDDLMAKHKRPDTPVESTEPVKDAFLGMGRTTKELAEEMRERPLAPVSRMASNVDRAITYARNKNIWFGTGLNQADFKRYNGQLKDGHDQVVASIAVDNALHAGHVGVQVAMLGKLKYDTKIGMFTAAKAEKSMQNVIKLKAKLVDQLGLQRAVNVINGYLEAKRSFSIMSEYYKREGTYENALAGGDLAGPSPAQIAEAKEELAAIEKAAEKVLMNDEEIDDFIALEDQYPELREILDNWTAVNRNLLDNMYFAGILSKGRYDKLKAIKDYVPWYRITDDMEDIHKPTAGAIRALTDVAKEKIFRKGVPKMTREAVSSKDQQDFDIRVNPDAEVFVDNNKIDKDLYEVKEDRTLRFKTPLPEGMTVKVIQDRPIDDMIDNMLNNVLMTTKNVMRNYAALKVVNAYGTRNEKGKLRVFPTEGTDENGVRFNILANGKRIVVQIKDPLIAESVLGLENLELPINGILGYFANGFRRSITVFPAFQLKQLFMDAPGAAWVSGVKNPFALWGKVFSSLLAALNPNDPITQTLRSKGIGGFQSAFRSPQKELELEIGLIKGNMFAQAMKVLDKIGDASDIAQRRAIYMQIMKETGDETLALSMAQNVIDFLRRGSGRPAQFVTRTVAFANAYAQSIDVLARTLAGGGLKGMDRKKALAQMVQTAMWLSAVSVLYAMAVGDDEEYHKLDDQTKFRGFYIPGSKEFFGEPLVLPMSTGASFFFKTIPEIAYNQIWRDGTESEMDAARLRKALSTAAIDSLLGPNMTPTAVKPFIEIALNRNFFTGTNLIPRSMEDLEAAEQYNATTSELGKVVSNLTSVPGTEKRLLAPIEADHLMRSLFGTAAATAMWGSNLLVEDRIDARMKDNPLYGPFFLPPVGRGREDLFYDLKDRVDKKYRTYQTMLDRNEEEAEKYLEKHEDLIDMYPEIDAIARTLSEINAEARLVGTSSDLDYTKKERTEDLRELQEEKNDILEEITELRREAGL